MVVNALIAANAPFQIYVGRTWPLEGKIPETTFIANAVVELFENDSLIATLKHTERGNYITSYKAKSQFEYHCKVQATDYPQVTTQKTRIPSFFPYGSYELDKDGFFPLNEGRNNPVNISIALSSKNHQGNFYSLIAKPVYNKNVLSGGVIPLDYNIEQPNDCFFQRRIERGSAFYYSGICLENKSNMLIAVETKGTDQVVGSSQKATHIIVRLRNISKEYFDYMKAYTEPQDIERAFIEPFPSYSNVIGGYGLWASFNEREIVIPL